jgi:predicted negative regulator of RcsB-dependent stress response
VQGYTRRELKQDKIAETAQGAFYWATEHRQTLLWTVGVLLVAAIIVVGLLTWNSRQTDQANIALSAAMRTFTAPVRPAGTPAPPDETMRTFASMAERGKEAEKEFQDIAKKYPYTKPGKVAKYMAGAAALDAGDTSDAEKQLKDAADMSNKDVASLAKLALATVYRVTNRQGEAAKIYKDLSDHPTDTVSKTQAQLELAEMYEATDPKQAQSIYQQIQKENPNTSAAQIAAGKLAPSAPNK